MFNDKVMTKLAVGSVWQTDINGKWTTPSLQGSVYTIGFFERRSKKVFLYASLQCQVEVRMWQQAAYNVPRPCRMIKVVPNEPFSQISWYTGRVKMDDCVQHLGTTGSNMGCGFHFCIRF